MTETNDDGEHGQSRTEQTDLASELNRLGENLGKLLKATWASDERRAVERELKSGLEQLSRQVNNAVEQARADQNVKKAKETIKEAWQTAHGPQVLNEMHMGLVDSLKKLNDEIARRAEAKPAHEVKVEPEPETAASEATKPE